MIELKKNLNYDLNVCICEKYHKIKTEVLWFYKTQALTCHSTGAAMSPAGATVLGDVLVASCTDIVDSIYIPPVPGPWQLSKVHEFKRKSCGSGRASSSELQAHRVKGSRFTTTRHQTKGTLNSSGWKGK